MTVVLMGNLYLDRVVTYFSVIFCTEWTSPNGKLVGGQRTFEAVDADPEKQTWGFIGFTLW